MPAMSLIRWVTMQWAFLVNRMRGECVLRDLRHPRVPSWSGRKSCEVSSIPGRIDVSCLCELPHGGSRATQPMIRLAADADEALIGRVVLEARAVEIVPTAEDPGAARVTPRVVADHGGWIWATERWRRCDAAPVAIGREVRTLLARG
jgi:hypothetical protein